MNGDVFGKKKFKKKTIVGIVVDIQERSTRNGDLIAEVRVRSEGKLWSCVFWKDKALELNKQNLLHKKIHVDGKLEDEFTIWVSFFSADEKQSFKPSKEDIEDVEKQNKKLGRIKVLIKDNDVVKSHWEPRDSCCKVNGKWESKLEYCFFVLGEKEVHEKVKAFMGENKDLMKINRGLFLEFLDGLVNHCSAKKGDFVELREDESETL